MTEHTLESLAERVAALEKKLGLVTSDPSPRKWEQAYGMFSGSEFQKQVDEEGRRIREADREAAQQEQPE